MLQFNDKTISVIGDVMLDFYIYCTPKKISAEAPILIFNKEKTNTQLGGAANVALNLKTLGCKVNLFSLTGNDTESTLIKNKCLDQNIEPFFITSTSMTTSVKTRIIAEGQQIVRYDDEKVHEHGISSLSKIPGKDKLFESDAIILSDYNKGTLKSKTFIQEIIVKSKSKNIPVFVDPIKIYWEKYKGAFCITPNLLEFEETAGFKTNSNITNIEDIAQMFIERYNFDSIIITLGQLGACLIKGLERAYLKKAIVQNVFDVCGAGDTFIAALTASYTENKDLKIALKIANIAAGLAVRKHGTATIYKEEIEKELKYDKSKDKNEGCCTI